MHTQSSSPWLGVELRELFPNNSEGAFLWGGWFGVNWDKGADEGGKSGKFTLEKKSESKRALSPSLLFSHILKIIKKTQFVHVHFFVNEQTIGRGGDSFKMQNEKEREKEQREDDSWRWFHRCWWARERTAFCFAFVQFSFEAILCFLWIRLWVFLPSKASNRVERGLSWRWRSIDNYIKITITQFILY